uniref:serine protease FAM111A-like n=1 Tax=Myodes glareolus TaxID=447135 RepID=UPI0020215C69|nr:serine protease FAM111A-like [Myodes glareolus]XP_048286481.1 serine protease FAM111A-like [Myodes glareolus]XP_048286482.1 serine protease FAM111A-like [Myodes glareolus]XP_048286483.1 serine protease FAM111A-like [Myodes glareolus]XP_048286484.1 serine protease FAM111A-like [Myodes glareolus]XP_048286485.1 serine protease FAM111A-like [Myodes glareolus]
MESRKRASEKTNPHNQCLPKKYRQDQPTSSNKTISITIDGNHETTLNAVKEEIENQQDKEMLVCGKEGIKGYINLGIPEVSHMVITFSKTESEQREDKQAFGSQHQVCTDSIKFYIHAVGKRSERILKCRELHQEGKKLCVNGLKGESIKDTLRKDGRFNSFVESDHWKLISDLDTIIENTQPIDELEGKLFQVEVERKKCPQAANSTDLEKPSYYELKEYIVNKYPTLKRGSEKIRAYIKEESEIQSKKTSSFEMHKANFGKLTKNSTPTKVLKLLSQFSDSVGLIVWNNNGNEGYATCFVFKGLYVLTCMHVINDIVGKDIEQSKWAEKISQCTKVIFDYEEYLANEENCFSVESWFMIYDDTLDYALLKLEENEQQEPAGLFNGIAPVPSSGLIYVIGHPDIKQKRSDGCVLVSQDEHIQKRKAADDSDTTQYIYMYTQRSFQEKVREPGVSTWNNTFYCGSSGSPIFDSKGSLIAMHTAGFICEYESGVSSIIEFGCAIESIFNHIKTNHTTWYEKECANQQDVEMNSLEC